MSSSSARVERELQIGNFEEPRRMRVCVTDNIGARVITDGHQTIVPVAHCGEIVGSQITLEPADTLGGDRRVAGIYGVVG